MCVRIKTKCAMRRGRMMRLCSWQNIVRLGEVVAVCHDCGDVAPTVDLGGKHDGLCGLEV